MTQTHTSTHLGLALPQDLTSDSATNLIKIDNAFGGFVLSIDASAIITGTLSTARLPIIPESLGGFGASVAAATGVPQFTAGSLSFRTDFGTVNSVAFTAPSSVFTVSGSPVTTSGTLGLSLNAQAQNSFFSGPATGGGGTPAFRTIVAADVPTLNQNTTGTAANVTATSNGTLTTLSALSLPGTQVTGNIAGNAGNVTDTVAVGHGGTGASTAPGALSNLGAVPTSRLISTTAPIVGGGDLSADRTLSMHVADATHDGYLSSADWSAFMGGGGITIGAPVVGGTPGDFLAVDGSGHLSQAAPPTSMAIGATIAGATAGSVLFADASGNLGQDNANFLWDTTNAKLNLGPLEPFGPATLNVQSTGRQAINLLVNNMPNDQGALYIYLQNGGSGDAAQLWLDDTTDSGRNLVLGFLDTGTSSSHEVGISVKRTDFSPYNLVLPGNQGTPGTTLQNDGSGNLSWASAGAAIGSPVTSGTPGSVLFVDGSGNLGQDNANLFYNATAHRLGIGTTTPASMLEIRGPAFSAILTLSDSGGDTASLGIAGGSVLLVNNSMSQPVNGGWMLNSNTATGALYSFKDDGTTGMGSAGDASHVITFFNNGSESARLSAAGLFGIGTTSPASKLSVLDTGTANTVTIQSSNSTGQASIAWVSDTKGLDMGLGGSGSGNANTFYIYNASTGHYLMQFGMVSDALTFGSNAVPAAVHTMYGNLVLPNNTYIQLDDAASNNIQVVAPTAVTASYAFTLPQTAGAIGQFLTSSAGFGPLTWTSGVSTADLNTRLADAVASKTPASAVAFTNYALTGVPPDTGSGLGVVGNYDFSFGGLLLLAGQTDPTENGLWVVNPTGAWARDLSMPDNTISPLGALVTIENAFPVSGPTIPFSNTVFLSQADGTGNVTFVQIPSWTGPGQLPATATNDSATAGHVGEFIQARVTTLTNVPASTGNWGDVTSISLTAGDWDVTGVVVVAANGATVTDCDIGISTTAGNFSTGLQYGDNAIEAIPPTAAADTTLVIPAFRVSLASTTTVYLKAKLVYTIATPQDQARISARRVR